MPSSCITFVAFWDSHAFLCLSFSCAQMVSADNTRSMQAQAENVEPVLDDPEIAEMGWARFAQQYENKKKQKIQSFQCFHTGTTTSIRKSTIRARNCQERITNRYARPRLSTAVNTCRKGVAAGPAKHKGKTGYSSLAQRLPMTIFHGHLVLSTHALEQV